MSEPQSAGNTGNTNEYQVIARRYRPQGFDQLVGQNHVAQALSNAIATHRTGHNYLFTGARGVGKTSTARIFAKALNCEKGPTATPCNVCDACEHISIGDDVDVLEIDGASNRGIDEIRQLRQNASIRPSRSRFKIYIIDEVHMLTREAFNALLKTYEEPPAHVKFIFCTTEANKIPITILSRCQRFDFAGIDSTSIAAKLEQIAAEEKFTAEEGVFDLLARRGAGSMRDAQSLMEQLLSFCSDHIKLSDVHEMLGTADDQRIFHILRAMLQGKTQVIFEELQHAANEGIDYGAFMEQLLGVFRDLMVVSGGGDAKLLMYSSPGRFGELQQMAAAFGIQRILAALQILDHAHNRMRFSTQERILLEVALVRIAHLGEMQILATFLEALKSGKFPLEQLERLGNLAVVAPPAPSAPPVPAAIPVPAKPPVPEPAPIPKPVPTPQPQPEPVQEVQPTTDLSQLNDEQATQIWQSVAGGLPSFTGMNASAAKEVKFQLPNIFTVYFPVPEETGVSVQKSFCETKQSEILAALEKHIGQPVQLRFDVVTVAQKQKEKPHPKPKHKKIAEVLEHPMVEKASELFGAEVVDVDEG